jgi:hypothetical protein
MLRERGAKYGVEIGTDHGKYAQQLLEGIPDLGLICIDPYIAYTEGTEIHTQDDVDKIYDEAYKRLYDFGHKAEIRRQTSMNAVQNMLKIQLIFILNQNN